jgi:hypothetical protein
MGINTHNNQKNLKSYIYHNVCIRLIVEKNF